MKKLGKFITMGILAIFLTTSYGCARVIEDGEAGVKIDLGKISEKALSSGVHFYIPFVTWIEKKNVKLQEIKETANVPSSEGLISTLDVSVQYIIPIENVVSVRENIGNDYQTVALVPIIRDAIRNVVSGYSVKDLYSTSGRTEIADKILARLKAKLNAKGFLIQDVLLRDVQLPKTFSNSIENKLKAEQEAFQKEFEVQKAIKDAEIEVERAKGVAQSNAIIAESITENYLRYRFIEGLNDGNSEIIYVPTEANLPILEATRQFNRK